MLKLAWTALPFNDRNEQYGVAVTSRSGAWFECIRIWSICVPVHVTVFFFFSIISVRDAVSLYADLFNTSWSLRITASVD